MSEVELQRQIDELKSRLDTLRLPSLERASDELSQVAFIAPSFASTSNNPTDTEFTGAAMGGQGWTFNGVVWNFVVVKAGILSVGASIDGDFLAANGEYKINEDGTLSSGLTFLHRFTADYGGYTRQGYIGMLVPDGGTKPSMRIYYQEPDATNLITNGSFDAGDETDWTDTNTSWTIAADTTYGYKATHDPADVGCPPTLTRNIAGLSASTIYVFVWASGIDSGYFKPKTELVWKDAGANVLRTDTIIGSDGVFPVETHNTITSPAATTNVDIKVYPGEIFTQAVVSGFQLYAVTAFSALDFYDDKIKIDAYPGKPANLFGLPESCTVFSFEAATSVTVADTVSGGNFYFYRGPTAANANDGDEYTYSFVLAAGSYTLTTYGASVGSAGMVDYYLDGTLISSGEDWYSGALTDGVKKTQTATIAVGGRHTLKIKLNGKNASSTDFRFLNTYIRFTKSAYTVEA
jgi:hypothetical protein